MRNVHHFRGDVNGMPISECDEHWAFYEGNEIDACPGCHGGTFYSFTVLCSEPDSPRGEYDEEIGVVTAVKSLTRARHVAEAAIKLEYNLSLKVRKVVQTRF